MIWPRTLESSISEGSLPTLSIASVRQLDLHRVATGARGLAGRGKGERHRVGSLSLNGAVAARKGGGDGVRPPALHAQLETKCLRTANLSFFLGKIEYAGALHRALRA